ncbi:hypothetical protein [Nocardia sp. NPDC020380]|uniref:hypothetical protein n=1 Tax=Nocardia sp. NPDC020380 TaxID=3364309 RepID=UPI0037B9E3D9
MAPVIYGRKARVCTFNPEDALGRLPRLYLAQGAQSLPELTGFMLAYRNAALCILGQIARFPQVRAALLTPLSNVCQQEKSSVGLEPILLTLLHSAATSGDTATFDRYSALWRDWGRAGAKAPGSDPDPVLCYDVQHDQLLLLTAEAVDRIRPGGPEFASLTTSTCDEVLQQLASAHIAQPFGETTPPQPARILATGLSAGTSQTDPQKKDAVAHCGAAVGSVLIAWGVALEFTPVTSLAGTLLILAGLSIEFGIDAGRCIDDIRSSTEVDIPRSPSATAYS